MEKQLLPSKPWIYSKQSVTLNFHKKIYEQSQLTNEKTDSLSKSNIENISNDVFDFISGHLQEATLENVLLCSTGKREDIIASDKQQYQAITNLQKANSFGRINKFLETTNQKLVDGGLFIGVVETYENRRQNLFHILPKKYCYIFLFFDFILNRIIPKLTIFQKLYYLLRKGKDRVITRVEMLGRLYACGFEIIDEKQIDGQLHFVAKKIGVPSYDTNPTYGPLITLNRVGKNYKPIKVFKIRTMHPYSEYLQKYVYEKNSLEKGGKLRNDFRVSRVGKILRKYWIDEIPMVFNFLKGDMKLIGNRPLSNHYFNLYSKELQQKRTLFKPGLIPPIYADMPETLEEIMNSEMKYLKKYEKAPLLTDLQYLFKICKNILVRGHRSA